jgi:hypothetical protein
MWAYEFAKKSTRYKVTTLKSFMKINHDLPKLWYEEDHVPPEFRTNFLLRVLKFFTYLNLLIIFIYILIDFDDRYYLDIWDRRTEWFNYCNIDFFPDIQWQLASNIKIDYNGNVYSNLFQFPLPANNFNYQIWKNFINENPTFEWIYNDERQARIHTCFNYCRNGVEEGFRDDNRPLCSSLSASQQNYLLWVSPEEEWEFSMISSEVYFGERSKNSISFSPLLAFIASIIVSPIYFIFDILCIILARIKADSVHSLKESGKVMAFQVLMTMMFVIITVTAIHYLVLTHKFARPELMWFTFLFSFIIDQIKTFLFLLLVWYTLVKRWGYLSDNENDFVEVEDPESQKQELFLPRLKLFCLEILESSYFENTSFALISVYTIFIFYWLTIHDLIDLVSTRTLSIIDTIFLSLFLSEISMKTFASTFRYLFDKFNLFDAFIVIISFILNLMGIVAKGLGVLRLIRVGVITVRKITGKEHKLRHKSKNIEVIIKILK